MSSLPRIQKNRFYRQRRARSNASRKMKDMQLTYEQIKQLNNIISQVVWDVTIGDLE
jgi:hypothetical protein